MPQHSLLRPAAWSGRPSNLSTAPHSDIQFHVDNRNRNRNLATSTAPTKAKLREPAYSQALFQIKSVCKGQSREVKQVDRETAKAGRVKSWNDEEVEEERGSQDRI